MIYSCDTDARAMHWGVKRCFETEQRPHWKAMQAEGVPWVPVHYATNLPVSVSV